MSSARLFAFFSIGMLFLVQNSLNYLFYLKAPALVLIGLLFYALSEGPLFGALLGLWAGFLMDLFGAGRPGFWMGAFAATGYFSGVISSKVFQDGLLTQIALPVGALYCVTFAEAWVLRSQSGEGAGFGLAVAAFLPWPLLVTALCSPWLFSYLRRWTPNARRRRSPARY